MKNKDALIAIIGLVFFGGILTLLWQEFLPSQEIACTLEAKLCPDGSYVGRTGPQCEFSECPSGGFNTAWATRTDPASGVTFQYPESTMTRYLHPVDWPPQAQLIREPFTCTEGGEEAGRTGNTERRTVDHRTYCVTRVSGAAAGSRYVQYAYAFPKNNATVVLTFSFQFPQCMNYAEGTAQTACTGEQEAFDIDGLVDLIAATVRF